MDVLPSGLGAERLSNDDFTTSITMRNGSAAMISVTGFSTSRVFAGAAFSPAGLDTAAFAVGAFFTGVFIGSVFTDEAFTATVFTGAILAGAVFNASAFCLAGAELRAFAGLIDFFEAAAPGDLRVIENSTYD